MIQFAAIDRQAVESHFADFKANSGDRTYNHLLLGKVVTWAEQFHTSGTLRKYIRREFDIGLAPHPYVCAKLFRAIHAGELPGVSEATYDALALNDALRVSPQIGKVPPDQIAAMLLAGIDGRSRFQRRSKDPNFPRAGNVYILVSSAHPMLIKIGRTQNDPYARAAAQSRQSGVTSALVVVWHERVSDCVAVETALHQRFAARKHDQGGDEWFGVTPKEAIPFLIELAQRYSLPTTGASTSCAVRTEITVERFPFDETYQLPDVDPQEQAKWIADYVQFAEHQDVPGFALDYPKTVKDLRADRPELRVRALRVCAASGDLRCIPLVVDQLRVPNRDVQVEAGLGLERLVTEYELRRRERTVLDRVEIIPPREGEVDLRALRCVLVDMLRCGEPNLQAYAADMISYLRLSDLEPTLRAIHQSPHPAAYRAVESALDRLGLSYKKRE